MRVAQALKSKVEHLSVAGECLRQRVNVDEFTAALWAWKRQLELHLGFYRGAKERPQRVQDRRPFGRAQEPNAGVRLTSPQDHDEADTVMSGDDLIKQALLSKSCGETFAFSSMRSRLSKMKDPAFKKIGEKLPRLFAELVEVGHQVFG